MLLHRVGGAYNAGSRGRHANGAASPSQPFFYPFDLIAPLTPRHPNRRVNDGMSIVEVALAGVCGAGSHTGQPQALHRPTERRSVEQGSDAVGMVNLYNPTLFFFSCSHLELAIFFIFIFAFFSLHFLLSALPVPLPWL